jgi:hypothetical protein
VVWTEKREGVEKTEREREGVKKKREEERE